MKFTIFGGLGFIGSKMADHLRQQGYEVEIPERDAEIEVDKDLGHVIYAIGLTGDFRERPFDTVDAHVTRLSDLLQNASFHSFLYLSSSRIYGAESDVARESDQLRLKVEVDALYDISKMLGEALCLACKRNNVRIARLANVYGSGQGEDTFLGSIISTVARGDPLVIMEAPESSKDYIHIADVVRILLHISLSGKRTIYNVASGTATTHKKIVERLKEQCNSPVSFCTAATRRTLPSISIEALKEEFSIDPRNVLDDLAELVYQKIEN
ncbi:MAG: SDR family oxidoreductase [Planctomycetaceae bacterium]